MWLASETLLWAEHLCPTTINMNILTRRVRYLAARLGEVMGSQGGSLAKTHVLMDPKEFPSHLPDEDSLERELSVSREAPSSLAPHPLPKRLRDDWEGRGAKVPTDACRSQESGLSQSCVRAADGSQGAIAAGCGKLLSSCIL